MSKLYFRYGVMNSSKTASALMLKYNYEERGLKALLVKPKIDIRDGELSIKSRCGLSTICVLFESLNDDFVYAHDVLIVDEAQFLSEEDVKYLIHIVDELDINVFCYGLRTDFLGNLFEGSRCLLAHADTIEELKTTCWCGSKATFTARLDSAGNMLKSGEQIEIGDDMYTSLCRRHFNGGAICYSLLKNIEKISINLKST